VPNQIFQGVIKSHEFLLPLPEQQRIIC
jgi:hypothetical protein